MGGNKIPSVNNYDIYELAVGQYSVRIYKSEQRLDYSWPIRPPLNPNIRDQKNLYAYGHLWTLILSIKFIPNVRIFLSQFRK